VKAISLFTGAGGLDIGARSAGIDVVFATDLEPLCAQTYCDPANFGHACYYTGSIEDLDGAAIKRLSGHDLGDVALLMGGPPCPPYSKSRFYRKDKPRGIKDPVGDVTLRGYLRALSDIMPKAFIFENVHGFAYRVHPEGFRLLSETATSLGYRVTHKILNAADYGVPQIRQRFFMVGVRDGVFEFPDPTHRDPADDNLFNSKLPVWRTAGDVLCDLDTEENANDFGHKAGGRHYELLKQIPPGENYLFLTKERGHPRPEFKWRSRYWSFLLKLSPDLPSWTIQARRSNNMGPLHWRNRILRIGEVKRLQTFPDDYHLAGSVDDQWRQVGNAVPPMLARVLVAAVRDHLAKNRQRDRKASVEGA
jgi:DNA (cytosine-5)-methyltransferase 1